MTCFQYTSYYYYRNVRREPVFSRLIVPHFSLLFCQYCDMSTSIVAIYNVPPMPPKWDRVGIFYISFCATWTTLVAAGLAFCWYNRHLPILRVRGLPLAFGAVIFLHLYWIMAQITYPIGATMPIVIAYDVQYFVMGTWFPLGIALFHASNLRFLRVAELQKRYTQKVNVQRRKAWNGAHSSWLYKVRNLEYDTKIMAWIVTGIVFQVCSVKLLEHGVVNMMSRLCSPLACGSPAESTIHLSVFQAPRFAEQRS